MGFQSQKQSIATTAAFALAMIVVPALASAQAVLRGVLYDDSTGTPLRGGAVVLVDPASDSPVYHTQADSTGVFSINIEHAGMYQIAAIHEGYQSILSRPVPFQSGDRLTVKIPIAQGGSPLHHIGVTEHVTALAAAAPARVQPRMTEEDEALSRRGHTGLGTVYDRQKLMTMNVHTVGDVLAMTPGVGVADPMGGQSSSVQMRQSQLNFGPGSAAGLTGSVCHVGWFLNGQRYDRPDDSAGIYALTGLSIKEVDAIEVYRSISEVPAEYAASDLRCGVVAVWTSR